MVHCWQRYYCIIQGGTYSPLTRLQISIVHSACTKQQIKPHPRHGQDLAEGRPLPHRRDVLPVVIRLRDSNSNLKPEEMASFSKKYELKSFACEDLAKEIKRTTGYEPKILLQMAGMEENLRNLQLLSNSVILQANLQGAPAGQSLPTGPTSQYKPGTSGEGKETGLKERSVKRNIQEAAPEEPEPAAKKGKSKTAVDSTVGDRIETLEEEVERMKQTQEKANVQLSLSQKQPVDKIQFASVRNDSIYPKIKENNFQNGKGNMPRQQVTVASVLSLGIFKDVMNQFNESPVYRHGGRAKQTKEDKFPLDRRRTKGKQTKSKTKLVPEQPAPEQPVPEQVNSNQLTNSANANSMDKAAILVAPPAYDDNDPPDEAPPFDGALPADKETSPIGGGKPVKQYQSRKANMTIVGNKTVQFDYSSSCPIEGKDAVSALGRATTLQCKQDIADVVCRMKKGSLYPQKIARMCPLKGKPNNEVDDKIKYKLVDDKPVRIVYVLVVHGRALRQVRRLIRLLFHTDHYFYIHVDSRSDYLHRELSKMAQAFSNIRLTPWRLATIWGGASLLQVYLRCMEDLLNMADWQWDFFINLSESDMPIKTNEYLVNFLSRYRKYNFLKAHGNDDERFIKKQGLDKVFYECDTHMWRLGDRKLPTGITLDGGSDWITINRQFVEYLITSKNELLTGLKQMYKYTLLPAESFFHTVLENSELCKTFVDNNLRVTNWKRKLGCQCQYKHIVDWCGCSPNDFKPEDMYKTKPNRPAYFARKFEPVINQAVINQLDTYLYGAYPVGTAGDRSYWQSLYHRADGATEAAGDMALTVYQSFVRLMAAHINLVSQGHPYDNHCAYSIKSSPTEVTLFFQNDDFRGVVVSVEGQTPNGATDILEVWLSLAREFRIVSYVGPSTRLQKFQVGTQYDLKERILRNFANIMGPEDSPIVFIKWKPGEQVQVTISWIDPTNHIAASFDTTVDHDKEETHHSPPFKKPLRPGKWYVKLLYQWMVVAEVEFLIVPQALAEGRPIQRHDSIMLNSGVPNNSYVEKDFSSMKSIFQLGDSASLIAEANKRAQNVGEALHDWVDEIVGQHWSVMGFCVAPTNGTKVAECRQFKPCYGQSWSTLSPDSKSDLSHVKPDGRIR